jgi:hypothetical protein
LIKKSGERFDLLPRHFFLSSLPIGVLSPTIQESVTCRCTYVARAVNMLILEALVVAEFAK